MSGRSDSPRRTLRAAAFAAISLAYLFCFFVGCSGGRLERDGNFWSCLFLRLLT